MIEPEQIAFYVGIFRLKPSLAAASSHDQFKILDGVNQLVNGVCATREHIRLALAQYKGNDIKRRWDLKFKYAVRLVLVSDPRTSDREIHNILENLFSQRTRMSVITSARVEAQRMAKEEGPEAVARFCKATYDEFSNKSKESNILI